MLTYRQDGGRRKNMFVVKGQEVESFDELPEATRKEAVKDVLSELYRIWLGEHGMKLESIEVSCKQKTTKAQ